MGTKTKQGSNKELKKYFDRLMSFDGPFSEKNNFHITGFSKEAAEDLKSYINEIFESEEKYKFLVNYVKEIIFKHNIAEAGSKKLIQDIIKDIHSSDNRQILQDEIVKSKIEHRIKEIFESEEKYRFLIEHIGEIIFTCDSSYIFTFLNPQVTMMLGHEVKDMLGQCLFDYVHDDYLSLLKEKLHRLFEQSDKIFNFEYMIRDTKGEWKHQLMIVTPIRNEHGIVVELLGVSRDITERKLLQQKFRDINEQLEKKVRERTEEINSAYKELKQINAKLIQSEKLAAIGELSSGIAHEFNNLIGIIQAYAEFAKSQPTEKNLNKLIDAVLLSSRRAKTITQSLLSFSRRIEPEQELANINTIIEEVLLLLETDLRKANISVVKDLDTSISPVVFDIGQIEQVLVNLLVNAKHALCSKQSDPIVIIRTKDATDTIELSVTDNGIGIKKSHLNKIFQPFFSTKGAYGKSKIPGTGLGLSVSLGIIEQHQGTLTVESEVNVGTTFTITLPKKTTVKPTSALSKLLHEKDNESHNQTKAIPHGRSYVKTATILVVDDEEYLRNALCDILSVEGYNLIPAEDGETAIELFKNSHFDLVLMDIMMPGIDGFETIKLLRNINPDIKILIISGSTHCVSNNSFKPEDVQGIIFKPFDLEKLIGLISHVLGETK